MKKITYITPRYAETDQMGVIHHSVYAIWYEQARTEFLNEIGLPYDEIEKMGIMTVVAELNSKYKLPAKYNEEVRIETRIIKNSPIKMIIGYEIYNKDNQLINIGETTLVWTSKKDFKIVNIKKLYPEIFERFESFVEGN